MLGNDYQEIELQKDAVVALTRQRGEIADLTNRLTDVSNEFRVPLTGANREALANSQRIDSNASIPYRRIWGRYEVDGVEILNDARAQIKQLDNGEARILLTGGEKSLFTKIQGKEIKDLDFSGEQTTWSKTAAIGKQNVTEGIIYAGVEYSGTFDDGTLVDVDVEKLPPSYYYHSLIRKIIEESGYVLDDSTPIWSDPLLVKRVIAFSNTDLKLQEAGFAAEERTNLAFDWNGTAIQYPNPAAVPGTLYGVFDPANTSKYDPAGNMATNFQYLAMINATFEVVYDVELFLNPHTGAVVTFHLKKNGSVINTQTHNIASGVQFTGTLSGSLSGYGDASASDYFEIDVSVDVVTWVVVRALAGFSPKETLEYGDTFTPAAIFPDGVKQDDFIRDFMQFYGLFIDVSPSSKDVQFIRHIDIKLDVEDWTDKVEHIQDAPKATSRLSPRAYGQKTLFRYNNLDWFSSNYAEGQIDVLDQNLPEENVFYESLFTASDHFDFRLNDTYAGGMQVPLYNNPEGEELGLRTGFVEIENSPAFWTFKDSTSSITSDYLAKTYFFNSNYDFRLSSIVSVYYVDVAEILNKYREISIRVKLSPQEVKDVDFWTIKNVAGTYFYLEKVSDWIRGELALCKGVRY